MPNKRTRKPLAPTPRVKESDLQDDFYTVKETSELFSVTDETIRKWIRQDKLRVKKKGAQQFVTRESIIERRLIIMTAGEYKQAQERSNPAITFWYPFSLWMIYRIVLYNDDYVRNNRDLLEWGFPKPKLEEWVELREVILNKAPKSIRAKYKSKYFKPGEMTPDWIKWVKRLGIEDLIYNPEALTSEILKDFGIRMHVDLMIKNGNTNDEIIDMIYDNNGIMLGPSEIDAYNKYLFNLTHISDNIYMEYLGKLTSQQERTIKFGLANQDMEVINFKLGKDVPVGPEQDAYMASFAYHAFRYEVNENSYKSSPERLEKLIKIRTAAIKNYLLNGGSADNSIIEFVHDGTENPYIKNDVMESIEDLHDSEYVNKQKSDQMGLSMGGEALKEE